MPRISYTPSGFVRDIPATELDPNTYTDGSNTTFREGLAQTASRGTEVFQTVNPGSAIGPPLDLVASVDSFLNAWMYPFDDGITKGWAVTDGNTHKTITPTGFLPWSLSTSNPFTDGSISGFPITNWGTQSAVWSRDFATPALMTILQGFDDTSPTPVLSPDWVPKGRAMRSHLNRLLFLNTVDDSNPAQPWPASEESVVWSSLPPNAASIPDDWFPRVDNSAGFAELSGGGPIIDGASLRSSFVVYLQDRVYIMDEIGGSFVFNIRKLSSTTGILTRNCVAQVPGGHIVLSGDDVSFLDGQTQESVIDNINKVNLFSQLGDNFQTSRAGYNASRNEVWIMIPTGAATYPNKVWILDLGTRKWGSRDLPEIAGADVGPVPFPETNDPSWDGQTTSWDTTNRVWNQAVLASPIAGLVLADPDEANSGATPRFVVELGGLVNGPIADLYINSFIQRIDLDLDDESRRKTVTRIWPRMTGQKGLPITLRVGARDDLLETIQWVQLAPFPNGEVDKVDVPFVQGRYISYEFKRRQGGTTEQPWGVAGLSIEFELEGEF